MLNRYMYISIKHNGFIVKPGLSNIAKVLKLKRSLRVFLRYSLMHFNLHVMNFLIPHKLLRTAQRYPL